MTVLQMAWAWDVVLPTVFMKKLVHSFLVPNCECQGAELRSIFIMILTASITTNPSADIRPKITNLED